MNLEPYISRSRRPRVLWDLVRSWASAVNEAEAGKTIGGRRQDEWEGLVSQQRSILRRVVSRTVPLALASVAVAILMIVQGRKAGDQLITYSGVLFLVLAAMIVIRMVRIVRVVSQQHREVASIVQRFSGEP